MSKTDRMAALDPSEFDRLTLDRLKRLESAMMASLHKTTTDTTTRPTRKDDFGQLYSQWLTIYTDALTAYVEDMVR